MTFHPPGEVECGAHRVFSSSTLLSERPAERGRCPALLLPEVLAARLADLTLLNLPDPAVAGPDAGGRPLAVNNLQPHPADQNGTQGCRHGVEVTFPQAGEARVGLQGQRTAQGLRRGPAGNYRQLPSGRAPSQTVRFHARR